MTINKNLEAVSLKIMDDLSIIVYSNPEHGFLISTKEVSRAYGRNVIKIYDAFNRAGSRLKKGIHFLDADLANAYGFVISKNSKLWTMKGFFYFSMMLKVGNLHEIKALEERINSEIEAFQGPFVKKVSRIALNLDAIILNKEQVLSLFIEVNKIPNHILRNSIANLLMGGR